MAEPEVIDGWVMSKVGDHWIAVHMGKWVCAADADSTDDFWQGPKPPESVFAKLKELERANGGK